MSPLEFHELMIMLSTRFAFSETSGYRTAKRNLAVGGLEETRHRVWMARDIVLDDLADTVAFTKEATRQGLVVVVEGDHLHVQGG